MDPNANLAEQRRILKRMLGDMEAPGGYECEEDRAPCDYLTDAQRLAELAEALDHWITKGGFLPTVWGKRK